MAFDLPVDIDISKIGCSQSLFKKWAPYYLEDTVERTASFKKKIRLSIQ